MQSGCVAATVPPVPQAPTRESLSDGATKIVAALRLRPDIDSICGGGEVFRDAMREAVINLMMSGEIAGSPRADAESAADFLHAHCAQPQAAQASAAAPNVAANSR
jgi:hypothetical protein